MAAKQSTLPRPVMLEQSPAPAPLPSAIPKPVIKDSKPESEPTKQAPHIPTSEEITNRLAQVKLDAQDYWFHKSSHSHQSPPCQFHLRVLDVRNPGAHAILRCIDHGLLIGDYAALVLRLLYDLNPSQGHDQDQQPGTRSVTLIIRYLPGLAAFTRGRTIDNDHKEIHLSADYIISCDPELRMLEVHGVLVHELVHCFQWDARGTAPSGLTEGIADWVRLECGLNPPHWKRRADGDWDVGYEGTGYFLEYLEERFGCGTVRRINQRLKCERYEERKFWNGLFGCSVWILWEDYRASLREEEESGKDQEGKRQRGETRKDQEVVEKENEKDEKENDISTKSEDTKGNQGSGLKFDDRNENIKPTPTISKEDEEGTERWSWVPVPSSRPM
ncbi:MAG: RNA processing protein [Watsoniomyces obsoletus]|nr:MAG: RNA processing protein [Watsoniomyces obsoletus]